MSAKRLASVMMVRDGEVQKRPQPIKIVERTSSDDWIFGLIIGLIFGAVLAKIALLIPPGQ